MKIRYLIPAVPIAVVAPVSATTYLSLSQAQALMFPDSRLTPVVVKLSDAQVEAIEKQSDTTVYSRKLKLWHASGGGWFLVDQALGKHEFITYAVALDEDGHLRDIEVMDYRESYGSEIRNPAWRAQFKGMGPDDRPRLGKPIHNISGATLSCKHVTASIRRLLATYREVIAHVHPD